MGRTSVIRSFSCPKQCMNVLTKFLEQPTRDEIQVILKDGFGEADHIDFKKTLLEKPTLAKQVLALASSGGYLPFKMAHHYYPDQF